MQEFINITLNDMLALTFSKIATLENIHTVVSPKEAKPPIKISETLKRKAS